MFDKLKSWVNAHKTIILIALSAVLAADIALLIIFGRKPVREKPSPSVQVTTQATAPITTTTTASTTAALTTTAYPQIDKDSLPYYKAAALYCVDDETMLYSDNLNERIAPASLTKLLTACTALKYASAHTPCTAGYELAYVMPDSSLAGIEVGDTLTLRDLVAGMLMVSGNDAAHTVAVSVAREKFPQADLEPNEAIDCFCGLMNGLAKEIGMENSSFTTPDGWDSEGQFTTAADLLKLTEYALSIPEIREIVAAETMTVYSSQGKVFDWRNTNQLLHREGAYFCQEAFGVKTGTTLGAGNNLIAAFLIDGKTYISVVTGCYSDSDRYEVTEAMVEPLL